MQAVTIVFPNQLYQVHPAVDLSRTVYLVEEELFFNQYNFHKQKLVLHRATMKMYSEYLGTKNISVQYIEAKDERSDIRQLLTWLAARGVQEIHYADVVDDWIERRISRSCESGSMKKVRYASKTFLNTLNDVEDFFRNKTSYFQTDFYIWQRKQRKLLLSGNKQPEGGKWTYDAANRLRFPKNETAPGVSFPAENPYVKEARDYVESHFQHNYGSIAGMPSGTSGEGFYPTTYEEAEEWLEEFLSERFRHFGIYEDAIVGREHFLHHSVLSPLLNTGLLHPAQVIDAALQAASRYEIPLNSLEGFIRQILGWREFIRIVYEREGGRQRTRNYWGFTRKIPASFWKGETGIVPVDTTIKKLLAIGYTHHIERLMVMANFMLLCEFDPDEVYRWFMEMYIDSYDWVMVPNVYGMTQFADGGLMATKPYISSSNYVMKMSDYKKGSWQEIWDGLFWRFMVVHRDFFEQNPRLGMLLKTFDKMPKEKRETLLLNAEKYLASLDAPVVESQVSLF
jgi:deoxyribodipyrimidine photolyase-related protein